MIYRILLSAIISVSVFFSTPGMTSADDWNAQWIGVADASAANQWLCYRKTDDLPVKPATATARIACDSKYWLWINDKLVVFEGQLKRGPTPRDTYFDTVDIAPYLLKGENTIAILVWYFGKKGFSHNSSGQAAMIFDATIDDSKLTSDATWKARLHPAYQSTDAPHPNFRLPESNIQFDARKDLLNWTTSAYNDANWPAACELGTPPCEPWNRLFPRPTLLWKNSGLKNYVNAAELPTVGTGEPIVCRLPYNCHATPYLKIDAQAGQQIDIETDNYRGGGQPNVRAVYITRDGIQEYESLGWMNGHDVRYNIPKGVKIIALKYRETGYNADAIGSFRCNDERLNKLWQKAYRTLYVTMRDTYMDCPDRERAQWWGDAVNEIGEAFYVFDAKAGPLLAKKGILELARWQREDGTIYSPVPSGVPSADNLDMRVRDGSWNKELPRQMLNSVGWYGFYYYYLYTGDAATIREVYPAVRKYLSVWKLGDHGLVVHRPGDWDWTDWGQNKDVPVIENAWYYLALKAAVEMAIIADYQEDIAGYKEKMASIEKNFNRIFWQGDKYHSPSYKGTTDDRANAMAVVAGLAKKEYYPAIRKVLTEQDHASPYMEKYVLESLYMMGSPEQAIERMKARWVAQIDSPLTTLWEGWGLGREGYGGGTYNHAWSGAALTILSQYAAGIAPTAPGFAEYQVLPQMAPLTEIDTVVPTPHGNIELSLRDKDGRFRLELKSPADTHAVVGIPAEGVANPVDIRITRDSRLVTPNSDLQFTGRDDRWFYFTVPAGNWTFETKTTGEKK